MRLPLLVLFSVSTTVTFKNDKQKEDGCGGQWDGSDLPKASMHFVVSLYKLVSSKTENAPPNFFLSPFSIYTTLAMLGLGARSSTQQQILDVMCLNASQADKILKDDFKNFLEKSRTKQGEVDFKFSNWLFLDNSISPDTQYQQDLLNYYSTYVQSIDFKAPSKAEKIINEQVSGHSDGKIEDLVRNVKSCTLIVLLDYVKFNAKWESPFTSQGTKRGPFKVNKLKTIEVEMMHQVGQFKTFKDHAHDCVAVEVPYTDQLVLLLIVPNNGDLDEVENKLSTRLIERYLNKAKTSLLDLYIPITFVQQEVNVQSALMKMGMIQAFNETADLSGISTQPGLKVSGIFHKTLINIAENQTESTEGAIIKVFTLPSALEFKIDRPFLALVYNKPMNTILLLGRVIDPSED